MKITIYSPDGITVVVGATEIDVQTKHGLKADPIPDEEWTQGFRFKENRNEDSHSRRTEDEEE